MPGQSRAARSAELSPQQETQPAQDTGPSLSGGGGSGGGGGGEPMGGGDYVVVRGDTLWGIARRTYGDGSKWREIARANPTQVFRDGELILVGSVLRLPTINAPAADEGGSGTPAAPVSTQPEGGDVEATLPRGECTEYGDFNVYPDEFVGPLPPDADGVRNVREAEYHEIIAAAEAEANANREQVEGEVNDLLSYGLFDWAITDGDATRAMELLGGLSVAQLRVAIGRIPNIGRLLDNLPSSARTGPTFTKVLVALGPDRVTPYLTDLLSYGIFDWAITDADALAVTQILGLLSAEQRVDILGRLGRKLQLRLLRNIPGRGSALADGDKTAVKAIFDGAGDGDMELVTLAFEVRFNLTVRGAEGAEWDAPGLRRSWTVLEALPAGHVEGNPSILQWIRDGNNAAGHSGWYADASFGDDANGAGYNYTTANLDTATQTSQQDTDGDGVMDHDDPLHGVNRFNKVVRHEIGHAVDDAIGGAASLCIGKPNGGNWQDFGASANNAIDAMVTAANDAVHTQPAATRTAFVAAMVSQVADPLTAVQATPEYTALDAATQALIDADPVFTALAAALNNPWYRETNGGPPLGGRVYQRSYNSLWTSYDPAARARKVSEYQYRAPGEWFAEAYAAYYQPNPDGTCDHHVLGGADPTTKTWFDSNVDSWGGTR